MRAGDDVIATGVLQYVRGCWRRRGIWMGTFSSIEQSNNQMLSDSLKTMRVLGIVWVVAALSGLSACATYQKCGLTGCPDDRQITTAVQGVIREYPELQGVNIVRVQTLNHVVYLYGQVDTEVERWTAQQAALSVKGVDRVVDSIGFQYEGR
jgi:osmotically-inducible protein OsmY